ncbi:MAG: GSCFA domain-containing protein [Propylenella sp.]
MAIFRFGFHEAQANYATRNRYARWFSRSEANPDHATHRLNSDPIFRPGVKVSRRIRPGDTIFAIGSCFARELERSMARQGFPVLSLVEEKMPSGAPAGWVNRYNTVSILRELEWASGESRFPEAAFLRTRLMSYVDLYSHPMFGAESYAAVAERRREITQYFARALSASMITISLGIAECWYDKRLGDYINFVPHLAATANKKKPLLTDPDRFEFRVLDFQENMENLEKLFALLNRHNPNCHIVVTVSPVSLTATFSDRDVVVATCLTKSMLRCCAETWQSLHPGRIDYFPSYEMTMYSDRKLALLPDGVHIQPAFVDQVIAHFAQNFIEGRESAEAEARPLEPVA